MRSAEDGHAIFRYESASRTPMFGRNATQLLFFEWRLLHPPRLPISIRKAKATRTLTKLLTILWPPAQRPGGAAQEGSICSSSPQDRRTPRRSTRSGDRGWMTEAVHLRLY